MTVARIPLNKRFYDKVIKTDACWNWVGAKTNKGYGATHIYINNKPKFMYAHRAAWLIEEKEIPLGLCVLHKCDNRACVRIDHHFLGTRADNCIDRHSKGRGKYSGPKNPRKAENHPHTKLTWSQVREIRKLYKEGKRVFELAKMFKICWQTADNLVKMRTWKE